METVKSLPKIINKLFDVQDFHKLARKVVVQRLWNMVGLMERSKMPYSEPQIQRGLMRLWEYSHVIIESGVDGRMRVLDAGGSGSILSYYLAAEGCDVFTIDISHTKVSDASMLSNHLGLNMNHFAQSITDIGFTDAYFDAVFCVCVIEHLARDQQPIALADLARVLKPGGVLSLTFDYGIEGMDNPILDDLEVTERLAIPSGLKVLGNSQFYTKTQVSGIPLGNMKKNVGSLFLKKDGELQLPLVKDSVVAQFPFIKVASEGE